MRLHDFLPDIDWQLAERAMQVIDSAWDTLSKHPYMCRKADGGDLGPLWRELLIDFGSSGYIVKVAAVRHQRESDYH